MKIFHLREKSSQHLLLPVWVVLGLVGRKLELAVPFSQLLQMKVHLDMFGIKKSCFFLEDRLFYDESKKNESTPLPCKTLFCLSSSLDPEVDDH